MRRRVTAPDHRSQSACAHLVRPGPARRRKRYQLDSQSTVRTRGVATAVSGVSMIRDPRAIEAPNAYSHLKQYRIIVSFTVGVGTGRPCGPARRPRRHKDRHCALRHRLTALRRREPQPPSVPDRPNIQFYSVCTLSLLGLAPRHRRSGDRPHTVCVRRRYQGVLYLVSVTNSKGTPSHDHFVGRNRGRRRPPSPSRRQGSQPMARCASRGTDLYLSVTIEFQFETEPNGRESRLARPPASRAAARRRDKPFPPFVRARVKCSELGRGGRRGCQLSRITIGTSGTAIPDRGLPPGQPAPPTSGQYSSVQSVTPPWSVLVVETVDQKLAKPPRACGSIKSEVSRTLRTGGAITLMRKR
ncbi:hypothetical protein EVAR_14452_1 [Eumeta japonica]|uniref:Uncharacterized protein n=1 Tax=Eumeta variegata TaxID=151549 RepID=A0A4C1U3P4_EUMVA|nr:hypothetical protein EVAR_14452_1 [Eumeta japonica]